MRSFLSLSWIAMSLAGCGMPENEFIVGYTERLCTHVLTCADRAELTFEGIIDETTCYDSRLEEVATWGAGCKFKASYAQQCLDDMDALQCPAAEGELAERPISCESVYFACGTVDETTEDSDAAATE